MLIVKLCNTSDHGVFCEHNNTCGILLNWKTCSDSWCLVNKILMRVEYDWRVPTNVTENWITFDSAFRVCIWRNIPTCDAHIIKLNYFSSILFFFASVRDATVKIRVPTNVIRLIVCLHNKCAITALWILCIWRAPLTTPSSSLMLQFQTHISMCTLRTDDNT